MRVKSKNILDINHDPLKNELHVRFHNGQAYTYHGVSADQFNQLLTAKSIGKHFSLNIKPKHIFTKILTGKK